MEDHQVGMVNKTTINMVVVGAHPWEWWQPPPFVED